MNILVDIGHPAHVHLMRNAIEIWNRHGHKVIVTTKDVPIIKELLDHYEIPYIVLGQKGQKLIEKIIKQLLFNYKLWRIAIKNDIDIATGTSVSIPIVSRFCRMKAVNMDDDDDEVQPLNAFFSQPFSSVRLSPSSLAGHCRNKKTVFYNGTHELAYLHPNRFKPDERVLESAGINRDEPFFILRLVAFNAYHDNGAYGLGLDQLCRLIALLKPYGRILITSEKKLHDEFEQYQMPVAPWEIHSLMSYCSLFISDSQTMTSEAAILGVPSFKCNTFAGRLSVPNELEQKYGLCYSYLPKDFEKMLEHITTLLAKNIMEVKKDWKLKQERFLGEKIDVTSFFVDFIEHFQK